jgi:hypothetical protein
MAKSAKKTLLALLAAGLKPGTKGYDRRTGKFLAPNGGWAVTNQDIILPLALLYTTPGQPHHERKRVLALAKGAGDALRYMQNADGTWEFIKVDGSRWGRIYQPWTIYHWAEAYALLLPYLGKKRRRRWAEGLTLAYEGLATEYECPRLHNIPTWNGMSLVRGAQIFDRPDWHEVGSRQVRYSVDHQHPDGYWPEGEGPTNG